MNLIKFSIITLCLFLIVSCDDDGGNNANNINNINNTNNTNNQNLPELRCQSTPSTVTGWEQWISTVMVILI
jgi:hypothetical protein